MDKKNIDWYEYVHHFCKLSEARYVVLIVREREYDYSIRPNSPNEALIFKELKWAKQCYRRNQAGTSYPEILQSRLIKIEEIR